MKRHNAMLCCKHNILSISLKQYHIYMGSWINVSYIKIASGKPMKSCDTFSLSPTSSRQRVQRFKGCIRVRPQPSKANGFEVTSRHTTGDTGLQSVYAPLVRVPLRRADAAFGQQASIRIYVSHKQKIKGMGTMKQFSGEETFRELDLLPLMKASPYLCI